MTSNHNDDSEPHSHRVRWGWWVLVALGVCGAALGAYGMYDYEETHLHHSDWSNVGYHTLQLFALHGPHLEHAVPWQLHAGRWLTAVVVLAAVVRGLMRVFRFESWLRLSRFRKDHIVICGIGWRG